MPIPQGERELRLRGEMFDYEQKILEIREAVDYFQTVFVPAVNRHHHLRACYFDGTRNKRNQIE